ncbi:response regulator transcription factor [Pedobacter duraquae]|uniref:Regulatory LuxR family protein n=1 Tax=Pedobacter duraquae TaxID=425511 RepID=A0A4R6ILG4_9SPHI|nr:helix-turn-helix transcriptional regulator [Pedobacter duraquae]TDO22942.1 regulatory LuxR family protein [Pedobacter duraquae]
MSIINTLNEALLEQVFEIQDRSLDLQHYQYTAFMYAQIENAIAVLSDMNANKSYIYNGRLATQLGLMHSDAPEEIDSIWEENIFKKIHPDDLTNKHLLELQFFNMLKYLPVSDRSNYYVSSRLRMLDPSGRYVAVKHRMFYVCGLSNGSFWLALCLYNFDDRDSQAAEPHSLIVNSATGAFIKPDNYKSDNILSAREKEILKLIKSGQMSKEIASSFSISVNTVNRHRQNILEKLRVNNSLEACRIAELMHLI